MILSLRSIYFRTRQNLPDTAVQVYSSNEFVITSHNLFIDTSQARLYLLGAQNQTIVLDISNPAHPAFLASYPNPGFYMPYVHDAYIRDNIGFMNCGFDGLWVVDFSNPASPVLLGTMSSYIGAGYNHSGWLSKDGHYYYMLDETHGSPVKVVDVSDYTDLKVVATIDASSAPSQIPHNALIRGNHLFVSYYYDGLQVFDISNPLAPQRIAYYDTYPGQNGYSYAGAWGVNPLLPSGNILISDIQTGLWVFEALDLSFVATETSFDVCAGETVSFDLHIGDIFSPGGVTLEVQPGGIAGNVQFSQNPAPPGSTVTVMVSGLNSTGGQPEELMILASDGTISKSVQINIAVRAAPGSPSLVLPAPSAQNVPVKTTFEWSSELEASSYKMQVSKNLADFSSGIVYSASTSNTNFTLSSSLSEGTTYAWRVTAKSECGESVSAIQTFTTEGLTATSDLLQNSFTVSPVPANDWLTLHVEQPFYGDLEVELHDLAGHQMTPRQRLTGQAPFRWRVADFPAGLYLLKVSSERDFAVRKILIQH
jgi:hypothetical protein